MGFVGVLKIGNGDFKQGFDVELEIYKDNNRTAFHKVLGRLPANTEVDGFYILWHQKFVKLKTQRGTDDDWEFEDGTTNISTTETDLSVCKTHRQKVESSTIKWLSSCQNPGWQKIRETLSKYLHDNSNDFQLVITVVDSKLLKLPWHKWDLIEESNRNNREVEITFSYLEYGNNFEQPKTNSNNKVKILTILGDSSGIDTEWDRELISSLNHASPTFLAQPTSQELIIALRQKPGWNMLIFAGHSKTINEIGLLGINENEESLEISEFRSALQEAKRNGLKIAIFNSCDGLGMAKELAQLQLPAIIIMRESVPDKVAHSFLKEFLTELAEGQSFSTSFSRARGRLEEFRYLPGATWLPMVFQNPAEELPTWAGMCKRVPDEFEGSQTRSWWQRLSQITPFLLLKSTVLVSSVLLGSGLLVNMLSVSTEELIVFAQSDPWLAGTPLNSVANKCEINKITYISKHSDSDGSNNFPVKVKFTRNSLKEGSYLTFSVKNEVNTYPANQGANDADGQRNNRPETPSENGSNGISSLLAPNGSLTGVFIGEEPPDKSQTPARQSFGTQKQQNFNKLFPKLNQTFFIGDGKASMFRKQKVVIPIGAKYLYLGIMDHCVWDDNFGSFDVKVTMWFMPL